MRVTPKVITYLHNANTLSPPNLLLWIGWLQHPSKKMLLTQTTGAQCHYSLAKSRHTIIILIRKRAVTICYCAFQKNRMGQLQSNNAIKRGRKTIAWETISVPSRMLQKNIETLQMVFEPRDNLLAKNSLHVAEKK